MKAVVVFTVWIIFAILFQSIVLPSLPVFHIWSDLLFYLVIISALKFDLNTGIIMAALVGHISDSVSLAPYGTSLISYILILLFIRKIRANIYMGSRPSMFVWVGVFSLLKQSTQLVFLSVVGRNTDFGVSIVGKILMQSFLDALLGLAIIPFIERMLYLDWVMLFRRRRLVD